MQRFSDWASRLERYLHAQKDHEFAYGIFDCCLFVGGAIAAMTGVDPVEPFRGAYGSRKSGLGLLARAGGIPGVAALYGMPEIPVAFAARGDMLLMPGGILALMALNVRDAVVVVDRGLALTPASRARCAWRV